MVSHTELIHTTIILIPEEPHYFTTVTPESWIELEVYGSESTLTCIGKIIRHLISHEIHHIGQLSIWSRELELKPVNSDLIIRVYF
ncbi:hypothetical protein B5V88_11960 [Heyndrickxia sporothermodurans]|nr:hypothetical protein [Heyndrickxia sporothermodurans]MBL5769854.1 hypothetical protein [Heyndrickxia sporothermodurans]MBL5776933.1 hypothetical protein [Heyndrickxia sporothermodurans]MBL5782300.1 hypothetical protein [Heyndrickxia sporothermodurans]MBL5784223.1 hypothetical protein [Heyndrickxia sporothermodurans]